MPETELIPLFPLPVVLYPGFVLPLHIFEPRYKTMIGECLAKGQPFGVVPVEDESIQTVGCTAQISTVLRNYDDGRLDILTVGRKRFRIGSFREDREFHQGHVSYFEDLPSSSPKCLAALSDEVFRSYQRLSDIVIPENCGGETQMPDPGETAFFIASALCLPLEFRRELLQSQSEEERLHMLHAVIREALGESVEPVHASSPLSHRYLMRYFASN